MVPDRPVTILMGYLPLSVVGSLTSDGSTPLVFPRLRAVGMDLNNVTPRPVYEDDEGSVQLAYVNAVVGWILYDGATESEWRTPGSTSLIPPRTGWTPLSPSTGTPMVTTAPPPSTVNLGDEAAAVAATLATNLTGSNNDLVFTSRLPGRLGNDVTVGYVNPGTLNASLGVVVSGRDLTVNLATNGSAVVTSTATQVRTAITAHAGAAALVTVTDKSGNDGSGVVTVMSATALSGGTGGLPLPPAILAL